MRRRPVSPSPWIYVAALQLLSCAVPRSSRSDWLAEWKAELWHVGNSRGATHRTLSSFCAGAVSDVLCLRSFADRVSVRRSLPPVGSVVILIGAAAVASVIAVGLPGVRRAQGPPLYASATRAVLISVPGQSYSERPLLHAKTVAAWQHRRQHLFREFAFYQPVIKPVHLGAHHAPELIIARASPNLFALLGSAITQKQRAAASDARPSLLLSESTWRACCSQRPEILNQTLKVGLETARVGGIVPDEAAPAGGHVDAWLIEPDSSPETFPALSHVFVIARLEPHAGLTEEHWRMSVPDEHGPADYDCVSLSARSANLHRTFFWAALIAFLSLPALAPVTSKEYVTPRGAYFLKDAARRAVFLATRISAVLALAYYVSLALAYGISWSHPETAIYLHVGASFLVTLGGVQWCLRDQARRCPVCLNQLRHPARVGEPSRNFLAWNGVELLCTDGHGLLHVPEIQTSWFAEPRWLMLDPSWEGLFPRSA